MSDYADPEFSPVANIVAEQVVLGSIILEGRGAYEKVSGVLTSSDFFMPRHGYIWDAITKIDGEIDIITIVDALGTRYRDAGGDAYLAHLMGHIPSSQNIEAYAQLVKIRTIARKTLAIMDKTKEAIMRGEADIELIISELLAGLNDIDTIGTSKTFKERVQDFATMRERLWDDPTLEDGLSWGLPMFDKTFGLIKPKNLIMVAGASKSGKSLVIAHALYKLAKAGKRVGLISLEMSGDEILARLEEIISGVNFEEARADGTDARAYGKLLKAWGELHSLPIAIHDESVNLSSIPRLTRQFRKELGGLDVLFVDYAGLIDPDSPNDRRAHWERMNEIAVYLKRFAIAGNLPIISAVQLNRQGFGKRPSMEYISGTIGNIQNANAVIAVWRPEDDLLEGAVNIYHMANRSRKSGQEINMVQVGLQLHLVEKRDLSE